MRHSSAHGRACATGSIRTGRATSSGRTSKRPRQRGTAITGTPAAHRGSRLDGARRWAASPGHDLSPAGAAFLAASVGHERRAAKLRQAAVTALAVSLAIAIALAGIAFVQQRTAISERDQAIRERDQAAFSQTAAEGLQLAGSDTSLAAELTWPPTGCSRPRPLTLACSAWRTRPWRRLSQSAMVPSARSPSARTAAPWHSAATTGRSSCGMSPTRQSPAWNRRYVPSPVP